MSTPSKDKFPYVITVVVDNEVEAQTLTYNLNNAIRIYEYDCADYGKDRVSTCVNFYKDTREAEYGD